MTAKHQGVKTTHYLEHEHRRELAVAVNNLLRGWINSTGSVSLSTSPATSTVVTDVNASANSVILLMPKDAAAAAEDWYITARGKSTFTINHISSASVRDFDYVVLG